MDYPKYSLHLFAGAGGGLLADIIGGETTPVCAVEIEKYPQRVLAKRFPDLAIWDDVCTFRADNPECADAFAQLREHADELVIAGGFPCQDISCAGRGAGLCGERVAAYGESMRELLAKYDRDSCLWKIHPCLFGGDLATFSETWPRWGMMRRGESYRLRTWEPCTCANGSGLRQDAYPTPTVHGNDNYKGASATSGDGLMTVVRRKEGMIPSPQARDSHSGTARPHGWAKSGAGAQRNLNDFVLMWPTPCAQGDTHYRLKGDSQASKCLAVAVLFPTPTSHDRHGHCPSELLRRSPNLSATVVMYDTPTVHGDGGSGRNGKMPKYGQLNPDWEEWLMFWPVGWTDIETPNVRLVWLDPSIDPADYGEMPRVTNRRDNRPARVKAIGNGQFPLSAVIAFDWGIRVLETVA